MAAIPPSGSTPINQPGDTSSESTKYNLATNIQSLNAKMEVLQYQLTTVEQKLSKATPGTPKYNDLQNQATELQTQSTNLQMQVQLLMSQVSQGGPAPIPLDPANTLKEYVQGLEDAGALSPQQADSYTSQIENIQNSAMSPVQKQDSINQIVTQLNGDTKSIGLQFPTIGVVEKSL